MSLRESWGKPRKTAWIFKSERQRLSALDNLSQWQTDRRTEIATPWAPDGAKNMFCPERREMLNSLYGLSIMMSAGTGHPGAWWGGDICDILTWDHNALSYRNGRLIILPTPSHFSHIYQNNVRFNMFEDTKYHGYTSNICPLKLKLNQE